MGWVRDSDESKECGRNSPVLVQERQKATTGEVITNSMENDGKSGFREEKSLNHQMINLKMDSVSVDKR